MKRRGFSKFLFPLTSQEYETTIFRIRSTTRLEGYARARENFAFFVVMLS